MTVHLPPYFPTKPYPSVQHLNIPDHPFGEVIFPNIQPESPLTKLKAIPCEVLSLIIIFSAENIYKVFITRASLE